MIRIMSGYSNCRCSTRDICGLFKKHQVVASVTESQSLCPSEDPLWGTGLEHHDAGAVGAGIQQQRSGFWMFSNRNAIGIDPRISQIIPKYPKIIPESSRISGSRGIGLSRHGNFGKNSWLVMVGWSWLVMAFIKGTLSLYRRQLPIPVFFRDDLNISHGDSAGKQCAKLVGHQLFFSHSLPVTMDLGQDSAKSTSD